MVQEFLSCLHGAASVVGIDQRGEKDNLYPVRRAVVLRALLEERAPNLMRNEGTSVDDDVLAGLLLTPQFRHGLRSLDAIIAMSKLARATKFDMAALPPSTQLSLHLDSRKFEECSKEHTMKTGLREFVAKRLHEEYRKFGEKFGETLKK